MGVKTEAVNQQAGVGERGSDCEDTEENSELTQLSDTSSQCITAKNCQLLGIRVAGVAAGNHLFQKITAARLPTNARRIRMKH